jgi:hypothetical protein
MTDPDQYSESETKQRMENAIRRAQKMPPTRHAPKGKKKPSPSKGKEKKD